MVVLTSLWPNNSWRRGFGSHSPPTGEFPTRSPILLKDNLLCPIYGKALLRLFSIPPTGRFPPWTSSVLSAGCKHTSTPVVMLGACLFACLLPTYSAPWSRNRSCRPHQDQQNPPILTCITTISQCTIIYIIGGLPLRLCDPACVIGLYTPKRWPTLPFRAAYRYAVHGIQLGLMRRRCLPLFQILPFLPHQTLIRWAVTNISLENIQLHHFLYNCF